MLKSGVFLGSLCSFPFLRILVLSYPSLEGTLKRSIAGQARWSDMDAQAGHWPREAGTFAYHTHEHQTYRGGMVAG